MVRGERGVMNNEPMSLFLATKSVVCSGNALRSCCICFTVSPVYLMPATSMHPSSCLRAFSTVSSFFLRLMAMRTTPALPERAGAPGAPASWLRRRPCEPQNSDPTPHDTIACCVAMAATICGTTGAGGLRTPIAGLSAAAQVPEARRRGRECG